jgi:hypothetical protein
MSKRVLLDENLPQNLRLLLTVHSVITVAYQGWAGISNGALIAAAELAGFDVMITADQGINYQQNLKDRELALVVLERNQSWCIPKRCIQVDASTSEWRPSTRFIRI